MAGMQMMMLGSSGVRFAQNLAADLISLAFAPELRTASIQLNANGQVGYSPGSSGGVEWVSPLAAGIGAPYWIRMNVSGVSNTIYNANAPGTWYPMSADQLWIIGNSSSNLEANGNFSFSVATDSGGTNIIATIGGGSWQVGYIN